jgi:hypothetical protein
MNKILYSITLMCFLAILSGCAAFVGLPADQLSRAQEKGAPLFIRLGIGQPDTAGGRTVSASIVNISGRTMKYIDITTKLENQVGDIVSCRTGFNNRIMYTGPIESQKPIGSTVSTKCYDIPSVKILVDQITITYMDDQIVRLSREELLEIGALYEGN